jgi:hypothetical protein
VLPEASLTHRRIWLTVGLLVSMEIDVQLFTANSTWNIPHTVNLSWPIDNAVPVSPTWSDGLDVLGIWGIFFGASSIPLALYSFQQQTGLKYPSWTSKDYSRPPVARQSDSAQQPNNNWKHNTT